MKIKPSYRFISLFLVVSFLLISGCAGPRKTIKYNSFKGKPNAIPVKAKLDIKDHQNISAIHKNSIINSIHSDLSKNLLNITELNDYIIEVIVDINRIKGKEEIWGLLWLPFVFVGAPASKITGEVDIALNIIKTKSNRISSYHSIKKHTGWHGMFYGKNYLYYEMYNDLLREAMEDIKEQVISDRERILAEIKYFDEQKDEQKTIPSTVFTYSYPKYSGPKLSIAVIDLKAIQVPEPVALIVSDVLRDELFQTQRFRIMSRTEMNEIFKEHEFVLTGACDDMGCYIKVGKMLTVEKLLVGNLSQLGSLYYLSLKMVDVNTAEYENIASARGPASDDELFSIVKSAVMNLISD